MLSPACRLNQLRRRSLWPDAAILWRIAVLHVIGSGRVGRGLGSGRFLGGTEAPGAVVAAVFDVVILGQRRDQRRASGDLADAVQNDFCPSLVKFDRTVNFYGAAGQAAHVADVFQVVGEDHDGERTSHLVFAEVQEMNAARADFDAHNLPGHTCVFADMPAGFGDGNAIGGAAEIGQTTNRDNQQPTFRSSYDHMYILRMTQHEDSERAKKSMHTVPVWNSPGCKLDSRQNAYGQVIVVDAK